MDRHQRDLQVFLGRMDRRHVRLILLILALILFVLGAGAPEGDGGDW